MGGVNDVTVGQSGEKKDAAHQYGVEIGGDQCGDA